MAKPRRLKHPALHVIARANANSGVIFGARETRHLADFIINIGTRLAQAEGRLPANDPEGSGDDS